MPLSEGFGFEEAWVARALDELAREESLFDPSQIERAQRLLGIGNRKVAALWDWMEAAGLVTGRRQAGRLSPLAELIRHYDPRLDEDGTLWILHTHLGLIPGAVWFYHDYSVVFDPHEFSRRDLQAFLASRRDHSPAFLEKRCLAPLLQVMRRTRLGSGLGVMVDTGKDLFRREPAREENLHPAVFGYALLKWARLNDAITASVLQMVAEGGPARLFALDEQGVKLHLRRVCDRYDDGVLLYSGTAGLDSIAFPAGLRPIQLAETYYLEQLRGIDARSALKSVQREGVSTRLLTRAGSDAGTDG